MNTQAHRLRAFALGLAVAALPACLAADVADGTDATGAADTTDATDLATTRADLAQSASTHRHPTDHGALAFGTRATASLTATDGFHAWELALTGPASLAISTGPAKARGRAVDTVLYLYRRGPTGWGSYIARNDDAHGGPWSALTRDLVAGDYRVLVKGATDTIRGAFRVSADCTGAGCAAAPATACVFGEVFHDLESQPALRVTSRRVLTVDTALADLDQRRVVLAVQQSSHTDVTTPAEAFAAVDEGQINELFIYEPAAARTFVAFEYGAGDNSYGAYFDGRSDAIVAAIHDGDLERCTVTAETCLLGSSYPELRESPAFTVTGARRLTAATQVTDPTDAAQILRAVQEAYDVTTLDQAFAAVDADEINLARYTHATGAAVQSVEFGAGDNSYGAVFYAGTTDLAAAINDSDFYGCTLFAAR